MGVTNFCSNLCFPTASANAGCIPENGQGKKDVSFWLRAVLFLQADPCSDKEDLPQVRGTPKMCPNPHKNKLLSYLPLSYSTGREESHVLASRVSSIILSWIVRAEVLVQQTGERQPLGATLTSALWG